MPVNFISAVLMNQVQQYACKFITYYFHKMDVRDMKNVGP